MSEPHHKLSVHGSRGALRLDIDLDLSAPWTVIFGPSGSGKSSLLRAACGLLPHAEILFSRHQPGGQWLELQGPARSLPSNWRNLSFAPQSTALFPHMSVEKNIAFGARGVDKATAHRAIAESLDLFALAPLAKRRPRELSGGEQQGVSLARAFAVPNARLMLLDEPFNGIDNSARSVLLPRMRDHLLARGIPALSVTHDVEEALMLNAWVVRVEAGKVVAQGPAEDVLADERHRMLRVLKIPLATPE